MHDKTNRRTKQKEKARKIRVATRRAANKVAAASRRRNRKAKK